MPITKSFNSKANAKQATNQDLPFNQAQPVIARYPAVATNGQTVINLTFSQDTAASDAFFLFINGVKQYIGQDFKFTAIASDGTSSQITMTYPLLAGQAIEAYKMGLKKESEFQTDNRFVTAYDYLTQGFQGFVSTSALRTAVSSAGTPAAGTFYSSIQNRAAIVDISQDLKASFGLERIPVQQIYQLQTEFGPNGEPVWAAANDDRGLIRFVGNWNVTNDSNGQAAATSNVGSYVEVTFYGTGLNILTVISNDARDTRVSTDGGSEGSNIFPGSTGSTILNARNYGSHVVLTAASGLTLGVHTVKIRLNATYLDFAGVEIINASSTTSLNVNPGAAYIQGQKLTAASASAIGYNSTFDSGTLGTKGGHVVVYQKSDGTIGKSVTPVNTSSAFMTSADHTNEEVQRKYHFREFSASRSDDFSSSYANSLNKTFVLDDGTTALTGSIINFYAPGNIGNTQEVIHTSNTAAYVAFTFVGTGLDITFVGSTGISDPHNINVDGTNVSTTFTQAAGLNSTVKIASGLPYGTHTVRITRNASPNYGLSPVSFVVYQPKKPAIPSGAVELADYNVMANYVSAASAGSTLVSNGVLRKNALREVVYVGSWSVQGFDSLDVNPFALASFTNGDYFEYTFYGTGIEHRFYAASSGSYGFTYAIDGSSVLTGLSNFYGASGLTYVASTGSLTGTPGTTTYSNLLSISGLPLGLHKLRVTKVSGTSSGGFGLQNGVLDIITPVYSAKSNVNYDQQNTLPVGSNALSDNRKTTPTKDLSVQKKNVSQALGIASSPTTTSTSYVPCPDLSVTHSNVSGRIRISYHLSAVNSQSGQVTYSTIFVDGVRAATFEGYIDANGSVDTTSDTIVMSVSPGVHKVDVYWRVSTATGTAYFASRDLLVEEI